HPLHFFVNNGFATMNISTNNNVGIGTQTPAFKLDVAGDVACNRLILRGDAAAPSHASMLCAGPAVDMFVPYNTTTARPLDVLANDLIGSRLILAADPGAPTHASLLCADPGVDMFVPYNTTTARPLNLLVRDAIVRQITITGGADLAEPFKMSDE